MSSWKVLIYVWLAGWAFAIWFSTEWVVWTLYGSFALGLVVGALFERELLTKPTRVASPAHREHCSRPDSESFGGSSS